MDTMTKRDERKWTSEAERSRSRRAYQRYWRNRRNYYKTVDQLYELDLKADRSLDLMLKAQDEMRANA